MEIFTGAYAIIAAVISIFLLFWPLLIWSHLREQTKLLRKIADKM